MCHNLPFWSQYFLFYFHNEVLLEKMGFGNGGKILILTIISIITVPTRDKIMISEYVSEFMKLQHFNFLIESCSANKSMFQSFQNPIIQPGLCCGVLLRNIIIQIS